MSVEGVWGGGVREVGLGGEGGEWEGGAGERGKKSGGRSRWGKGESVGRGEWGGGKGGGGGGGERGAHGAEVEILFGSRVALIALRVGGLLSPLLSGFLEIHEAR